MIIRKETIRETGILAVWEISETKEELLALFSPALRQKAEKKISMLKSETRILQWLGVRVLLYRVLHQEKTIKHHRNGRPYLTDNSFNISISHSGNFAAIILHPTLKVGVDVEKKSKKILSLAKRFVSDKEYIGEENAEIHALLHWSAKETVFKILDEEDIDFKEHIEIHPFKVLPKGEMNIVEHRTSEKHLLKIEYEVFSDAVFTWATQDVVR